MKKLEFGKVKFSIEFENQRRGSKFSTKNLKFVKENSYSNNSEKFFRKFGKK